MRIKYAIHSSDSNPLYLDFWKVVAEIWVKKFDVIPILAFIGDEDYNIDETYGIIIRIKPLPNIPIHLQTQIIRFWIPVLYPNEILIVSDIDMLPLSYSYFITSLEQFKDDDYVHLNPCIESYGRLPACYHVAKGATFKEVLQITSEWKQFIETILCDDRNTINHGHSKEAWFADEIYTSFKVLNYHDKRRIKLKDRENGQNGYRIDRLNWKYYKGLLKYDYYYDAHSIRPFKEHEYELLSLKEQVINSKKLTPPIIVRIFYEISERVRFQLAKLKVELFKSIKMIIK